ncbi:MAG: S9 family peptidase [Phycisphaeraceae bacterium]|nr:S9 family peptidase [Phycisphaeraceae bacterium]
MKYAISLILGLCTFTGAANHPPTVQRPVKESLHGQAFVDEFRWLEGDNSDPSRMGRLTEEVSAWTDIQNGFTRDVLDNLPGRKNLEARLRELMEVGSVSSPSMRGNRYFYTRREGTQAQAILYVRDGHDGVDRELLDPAKIDPTGLTTMSWSSPSPNGKLVAFGLYRSGDENSTLYLLDVDSGRWLAEEIPGKVNLSEWLPDSSGFFYSRLEDLDDPYSSQFRFHRIGTHHRQDPILFRQKDVATTFYGSRNLPPERLAYLAKTWGPYGVVSRDARWMVVGYWTGTNSIDLWVADLAAWFRTGTLELKEMAYGLEGRVLGYEFLGDTLYMTTSQGASNGRLVAVDLHNPAYTNWKDIIPEHSDAVLRSVSMARGLFVARWMQNAYETLEMYDLAGNSKGSVPLPGIGSASIATRDDRTEAFVSFASFNTPPSIFRVDLASGTSALWAKPDIPVDPSIVDVRQVWYTSRDGTEVPMFIIHRKGLRLDGNNPTILYGYGGFNISQNPFFSPTLFPWFEAGGVFAVANLRGGGEFGNDWHRAGMLESKQNVFDDFIAAAEWLCNNGYTNPSRLACSGGSNGGLLVGAVVTQRPDLFKAAICAVPLLDMLRYQDFLMARYWVPEYGSAENPEQFEYLARYSPYQQIREGVKYPAMLITAGENDTRVHPMHARKMAARMQAATTADPASQPILLWVDRDAGHGGGKPLELRIRDVADQRIFMMWQLGMLDRP